MTFNQNLKNYISKGNARLFFALLLVTSGIWLIIQLSKTYNANLVVTIEITEVPVDQVLEKEMFTIDYELKTSGFKLFWLDFKSNLIDFELSKLDQSENAYTLNSKEIKASLTDKYSVNENNIKLNQDTFKIHFSEKEVKYVKVNPDINYSFAAGYNTVHQLKTDPDSIKISGKKNILDQIKYLKTEKVDISKVDDTINRFINIKIPKEEINIEREQVKVYLPVEKFTEDEKVIPIQLVNVPDSLQVNYFPKNVSLNYLVAISKYNKITAEKFIVQCDFENRFSKQGIIIPKVIKKPQHIKNINISPSKIEFLIKK